MRDNDHYLRRGEQLGISFGTASNRLKKMLMLRLLQKLGEDNCFRCEQKITDYRDLSVDHKKPWQYISKKLFWDLENIAFSHMKCNRPDRPGNQHTKRIR